METAREFANLLNFVAAALYKGEMSIDEVVKAIEARDAEMRRAAMAECADYLKGLGMVVAAERIEVHAQRDGAEKEGRKGGRDDARS